MTISAWTQPGCKNPDNDPNAEGKGDDFKKGLSGWCLTKKAAAIFFWFAFGEFFFSLVGDGLSNLFCFSVLGSFGGGTRS